MFHLSRVIYQEFIVFVCISPSYKYYEFLFLLRHGVCIDDVILGSTALR